MSDWKSITLDCESDGLLDTVSKIWCIGICDNDTGEVEMYSDEALPFSVRESRTAYPEAFKPLDRIIKRIEEADTIVMHNGLAFDKLLLDRFYKGQIKWPKIIDTLVLSRLWDPELGYGQNYKSNHAGHSVAAWTKRLNLSVDKVEYNDWTEYSPLIPIRCEHDILIQREIFLHLRKLYKSSEFSYGPAIKLEHDVQEVAGLQEMKGWRFNKEKCEKLITQLNYDIDNLSHDLYETMPPRVVPGNTLKQIFKKNGEYTVSVQSYFESDNPDFVGGIFSKVSFPRIDLGSAKQVKDYLLSIGWKPDTWNVKTDKYKKPIRLEDGSFIQTSPKVTLTSLESLGGFQGESFKRLLKSKHRRGQLELFLRNVRSDGRIAASVNTIATVTHRMSHRVVANVPKASPDVFLGKEIRSLFSVDDDYVLIGVDQSSLEARIFASLLNDPIVIHELTSGDVHEHTRKSMGLASRNIAKAVLYLVLYGGGAAKAAATSGIDGKEVIDRLELAYPGLKDLRKKFTEAGRKGWIKGLDGRKIVVREDYRTFNTYIQSAGSIIVKRAYVMIWKAIQKYQLDAFPVGIFHDEVQYQCHKSDVNQLTKICEWAMIEAGKKFNLKCPLSSEVKTGKTWEETH